MPSLRKLRARDRVIDSESLSAMGILGWVCGKQIVLIEHADRSLLCRL